MHFSELWTSRHQHCITPVGPITLNVDITMSYSLKKSNKCNVSSMLINLFRDLLWDSIDIEKQGNPLALILSHKISILTRSICILTSVTTGTIRRKWKGIITLFCWGMSVIRQICHPSVKETSIEFYRIGCPRNCHVDTTDGETRRAGKIIRR